MHSPLGSPPRLHLYVRLFSLLYNNPGVWRRWYWTYRLMVERWILLQERFLKHPRGHYYAEPTESGPEWGSEMLLSLVEKKKQNFFTRSKVSTGFFFPLSIQKFHGHCSSRSFFFLFFFFLLSLPAKVLTCFVCSCGDTTPEMWSNKSQSDSKCSLHTNVWTALVSR